MLWTEPKNYVSNGGSMAAYRKWTNEEIQKLIYLRDTGYTQESIGKQLYRTKEAVAHKVKGLIASGAIKSKQLGRNFSNIADIDLPIYTETPVVTDNCIVVGDIHIPTTFWELADKVSLVADGYLESPKTLIVAGDFINADAISKYPFT
ncbi:hypothetical protein LCGC14_3128820, partial [marine sediment metagenome]